MCEFIFAKLVKQLFSRSFEGGRDFRASAPVPGVYTHLQAYLHQPSRYIFFFFTDRYFNLIHFYEYSFRDEKKTVHFDPLTWNNFKPHSVAGLLFQRFSTFKT